MVTHRNRSGPDSDELNWNRQPVGMVKASPGITTMASTVDGSVLGGQRHTFPLPSSMYQTSSTV